jgi:hypothetical protein
MKHRNQWADIRSWIYSLACDAWRLIWAQRKVVGREVPWGSAAALAVAALIIWSQSDSPRQHFQLVCELLLPLVGAISAAYLFSPENDPPLELLYTCPCPVPVLLAARLAWLGGIIMLPAIVVQVTILITQPPLEPGHLWALIRVWVPPAIFLSGLGLLAAQLARSALAGVLAGAMVWTLQVLVLRKIFLAYRALQSFYLFITFAGEPLEDVALNRWTLLLLGLVFIAAGLALARESERRWSSQ